MSAPRPLVLAQSKPLFLGAALLGCVLLLTALADEPPAPVGLGAPEEAFSAGRAEAQLNYLLSEKVPHPIGSPENLRIRGRIERGLRQLGYQVGAQEAFTCREGSCGKVQNVLARLPGKATGKAVLLIAHYDSVGAGPGAGDNGAGVAAALEVARALSVGPPPERPVLLLFDDGEEAGLLGAQAFRDGHPAAGEVGAIVNLDARGSAGPSLMFETSGDSAWLVRALAGALPHPRTSSVFVSVYEQLPNDTDLSVFREARVPGVNFAFIRNVVHYHTPLDDLAHLSRGTLQHHGENALAMVRALCAADLDHPAAGRAVFFDVLGRLVVSWPARASVPLAAAAAALLLLSLLLLGRSGQLGGVAWLAGLVGALLTLICAVLLGVALSWLLLRSGGMPRPWVAFPAAAAGRLAFAAGALLAVALGAAPVLRRAGPAGLWAGTWTLYALLGLAAAALQPGVSYLLLVPVLGAGLVGLLWALLGPASVTWLAAAALVPALLSALTRLPIALSAYDAMGRTLLPLTTVLGASVLAALSPLWPLRLLRALRSTAAASACACAALVLVAALSPTASQEAPERLRFTFHQDGEGRATWLALTEKDAMPPALLKQAAFGSERGPALPWLPRSRAFSAPAPALADKGPELQVLAQEDRGGERHIRALLRSRRGAQVASLHVSPQAGLLSLRAGGEQVPQRGSGRWPGVLCHTLPREGLEIELVVPSGALIELYIADQTRGLPPAGAALLSNRPSTSVPSHEGDVTVLSSRLQL